MGNTVVRVNGRAYENVGAIAEGGFASVYQVRRGDQRFALKWIRGVTEREHLERVLLEIQVQRKLQHPNSMRLIDAEVRLVNEEQKKNSVSSSRNDATRGFFSAGMARKEVLMIFPLYPSGTLQTWIDEAARAGRPVFSETECLRIFELIVEAVLELHARGYAHRDIKPGNILLTSDDRVEPILMDFGSVSPVRVPIQTSQQALLLFEEAAQLSTAPYRAPELWEAFATAQFRGHVDGRTDVWSLGCLLYAMAFGPYSPFESATEGVMQLAIYNGNVRFPSGSRFGSFSPRFTAFIRSMLTPEYINRPSILDVLHQVQTLQGRRRGSSVRLRAISSIRQLSLHKQPSSEGWADFSAFEGTSSESTQTMTRGLSSSNSWKVDSRRQSSVISPPHQERMLSRTDSRKSASDLSIDTRRRTLSTKGKQLLADALTCTS